MTTTTEFNAGEVCTAVIDTPHPSTGDRLQGPLQIGYYPLGKELAARDAEVWIEQEGKRVQFHAADLPAVIKQLRRAVAIAQDLQA